MRRSMKKHLSLILAALMLFTSIGFSAVAVAGECDHQTTDNPDYCKQVSPTCTEDGYTIRYCVLCSNLKEGKMVEVKRDKYISALGHSFNNPEYVKAEDGDGYNLRKTCTRNFLNDNGEPEACGVYSYDMDGNNKTVYYLVNFNNNKVADKILTDITGALYADPDSYKNEVLASYYVKAGDSVWYDKAKTPSRYKTVEFGAYSFVGWTINEDNTPNEESNTDGNCLEVVNGNTELYPVFVGEQVKYGVKFHDAKGNATTKVQEVVHGETPYFRTNASAAGEPYNLPEKDSDIYNDYKFIGWKTVNSTGLIEDVEAQPIYAQTYYYPEFEAVARKYEIRFYNYTEKELLTYGDEKEAAVFGGINLRTNLTANNDIALLNTESALAKPGDGTYVYTWTGEWRVLRSDGTYGEKIKLSYFDVQEADICTEEITDGDETTVKSYIKLAPVYTRRTKIYPVKITMVLPTDENAYYNRAGAEVQVKDKNGQLKAAGKTDDSGSFECLLDNYAPYTISVATSDEKYLGTGTINTFETSVDGSNPVTECSVLMQINPDYEKGCTCLHHNPLLQPVLVTVYNFLYSLFQVKYVCCYDMYSTIGPLLNYVSD